MKDYLSVTEIVQLTECAGQFHFDQADGSKRSEALVEKAAKGEAAHRTYEKALRVHANPHARARGPRENWFVRLVRWLIGLFGWK